jgi:hypothetical protein
MKVKAKNISNISFRCSKELHEQAEKLSELTMIPVSIMCRLALSEYIKNHSVSIVVNGDAVAQKPSNKPAPPKSRARDAYSADDRLLDTWVRENEITVDKVEYGDDW